MIRTRSSLLENGGRPSRASRVPGRPSTSASGRRRGAASTLIQKPRRWSANVPMIGTTSGSYKEGTPRSIRRAGTLKPPATSRQKCATGRRPKAPDLDRRLLKEGRVPPLNRDRFLTFVPDLGGFNNVRLALENVVVLARRREGH